MPFDMTENISPKSLKISPFIKSQQKCTKIKINVKQNNGAKNKEPNIQIDPIPDSFEKLTIWLKVIACHDESSSKCAMCR